MCDRLKRQQEEQLGHQQTDQTALGEAVCDRLKQQQEEQFERLTQRMQLQSAGELVRSGVRFMNTARTSEGGSQPPIGEASAAGGEEDIFSSQRTQNGANHEEPHSSTADSAKGTVAVLTECVVRHEDDVLDKE